ncbi:MAG: hypothetical protein D9N13_17390 [Ketobacter sp. GenoA1]|nr:MAG: hypothetical protein D9N13_17390 [Ketobacter sp. GenoA1]RLT97065.1 MAG: hypothetical protein D9N15_08770 [Ketobacter sp.]
MLGVFAFQSSFDLLTRFVVGVFQLFFNFLAQFFFTGNHFFPHFVLGFKKTFPQLGYLSFQLGLG